MQAGFAYVALMIAHAPPVDAVLNVERGVAALYGDTSYTEMEKRVSLWRNSSDLYRKEILQSLARALNDRAELRLDDAERVLIPFRETGNGDAHYEYYPTQDVLMKCGRAAWAIGLILSVPQHMPILHHQLTPAEHSKRANAIRIYISTSEEISRFFDKTDYQQVADILKQWSKLPSSQIDKVLYLLAAKLHDSSHTAFTNNTGLHLPTCVKFGYRNQLSAKQFQKAKVVLHDLFVVQGKAAWAIQELIGVELPDIIRDLPEKEMKQRILTIEKYILPAYLAGTNRQVLR
ncbi:MAG: hypothetical protein LC104_10690 [Bacteroidales bacterium]|nr:hypothetical protein [Bacteroidales bacterium]